MPSYNFQTNEFGISDNGIHLLRSGFNYKTITFSELKRVKIEKGKELHNWWLVFIFGAALIGIGVYLSLAAINVLTSGHASSRNARMILLLFIPLTGAYFVYNSVQTGLVMKIECTNGEKDMFPLRKIIREQKLGVFITDLKSKIGTRLQVAASKTQTTKRPVEK